MKTILFFAIVAMFFAACNNEGPDVDLGIQPVAVTDEVKEFFIVHLPEHMSYSHERSLFFPNTYGNEDFCMMINNNEELAEIIQAGSLPVIDFGTHTLVLGQYTANHGGIYLASQGMDVNDGNATIHLLLRAKSGDNFFTQAVSMNYFWGLYPKTNATSIEMNIIRKN